MIKTNFGQWAVASILFMVLSYATAIPGTILQLATGNSGPEVATRGVSASFIIIMLVSYIIQFAFTGVLAAGFIRFVLHQLDGNAADFGQMFVPFRNLIPNMITSLITYFMLAIGFACCIVPGIYLTGNLLFTNVLVTEGNLQPGDSIRLSFDRMKPHAWNMFGLYFVAALASGLGVFACCVGLLVTLPILYVVLAMQFRVLFPEFGPGGNPVQIGAEPPRG
ncbi:MAG: hypothetical protein J0L72_09095 [Armatimonadetes bacterium]|nr:hypothetical protein [Armatimonadota bacterium]